MVRPARPEDAPGIVALVARVVAEGALVLDGPMHPAAEERRLLAETPPERFRCLVAEADGRIVGHLVAVRGGAARNSHVVTVAVAVLSAYRRRGVAGALVAELLAGAGAWAATGVRRLEACVLADNAPALRLFEAAGFTREGVRRQAHLIQGVYQDEVILGRLVRAG